MITASIDVTLFDKTKFKNVVRKNGNKAVFADICLIETPNSEYGDYMVVQGVTKEERLAGVKGKILGNGKSFEKKDASAPATLGKKLAAKDALDEDVGF